MTTDSPWRIRFERERASRREAESILHAKSRALFELNQQLEARAEDLARALQQLKDAQDQMVQQAKFAAMGGLVAGVAHEINTPLGVAVTASSVAIEHLVEAERAVAEQSTTRSGIRASLSVAREAMELATINLDRAARLIDSFKRLAVDQSSGERRAAYIEDLVREVVMSLQSLSRRCGAQVKVSVAAGDPARARYWVDAGAFVQVSTNLLQNACTHAFEEHSGPREVRIGLDLGADRVVLRVADTGVGMTPQVAARVFDPFFTTQRASGGSGLGMHLVHTIVTGRFKGRIDVETAPGAGTAWTVRLPVGTEALAPVSELGPASDCPCVPPTLQSREA